MSTFHRHLLTLQRGWSTVHVFFTCGQSLPRAAGKNRFTSTRPIFVTFAYLQDFEVNPHSLRHLFDITLGDVWIPMIWRYQEFNWVSSPMVRQHWIWDQQVVTLRNVRKINSSPDISGFGWLRRYHCCHAFVYPFWVVPYIILKPPFLAARWLHHLAFCKMASKLLLQMVTEKAILEDGIPLQLISWKPKNTKDLR